MEEILFAKISNGRKKKLRIVTKIILRDGKKYVEKTALNAEGSAHIHRIYENKRLLEAMYAGIPGINICDCELQGNGVVFPYVEGEHFDQYFDKCCFRGKKEEIISVLESFYRLLLPQANRDSFEKTENFIKIFGDAQIDPGLVSGIDVNIDMIFPNIIIGEQYYVIDYEWVFSFPVPIEYVFYRALITSVSFSVLENGLKEEIYEHFYLNYEKRKSYESMEVHFQNYVKGHEVGWDELRNKFQTKCVRISDISWDKQSYLIKCFGRDGDLADELYSGTVTFDKRIRLEIQVNMGSSYDRIEIFGGPLSSVISIYGITGFREGCSEDAEYVTTADFTEENIGYYDMNTPVFIIKNKNYEKVLCEYEIRSWDRDVVKKIVTNENMQREQQKIIGRMGYEIEEKQVRMEHEIEENKKMIAQLQADNRSILNEKNALEQEINMIKNSKTWKVRSKIKKWISWM